MSLTVSLFFYLCFSPCLSVSLCLCVLSVYFCLCLSLSLSVVFPLRLLSVTVFDSSSGHIWIFDTCVEVGCSVGICVSPLLVIVCSYVCICLCLCPYTSIFLCLYLCLALYNSVCFFFWSFLCSAASLRPCFLFRLHNLCVSFCLLVRTYASACGIMRFQVLLSDFYRYFLPVDSPSANGAIWIPIGR